MTVYKSVSGKVYIKLNDEDKRYFSTVDGFNIVEDTSGYWDDDLGGLIIAEYENADAASIMNDIQEKSLKYLSRAKEISKEAHNGQKDLAGKDYFSEHITTVAKNTGSVSNSLFAVIAAYLHDVIEDTNITPEELSKEFPTEIVDTIVCLTRKPDESYESYINRVKTNKTARIIKICDLANNMDLSRLPKITDKDIKRIDKYQKAFVNLMK